MTTNSSRSLQEDYYRMLAIFEPIQTIEREGKIPPFPVGKAEHAKRMSVWQPELDALYQPLNQLRLDLFERCRKGLLADPKPKVNEKQFEEMLAALKTDADKRTKQQADLLLVANGPPKHSMKRSSDLVRMKKKRSWQAISQRSRTI